MMEEYQLLREYIREALAEDVRKVGDKYCAYVDDKLTKKEKENKDGRNIKKPLIVAYR